MKISKLIKKLGHEIDGITSTRDELLERALALGAEISELERQRSVVIDLEMRYAADATVANPITGGELQLVGKPQDGEDQPQVEVESDQETLPSTRSQPAGELQVAWPIGAHYQRYSKAPTRQSWARYKLGAADWYLSTLIEIGQSIEKLDRLLGVEMAIDGTIHALCTTFDAAVYSLMSTLEINTDPTTELRTPARPLDWHTVADQAEALGVPLRSASSIADALAATDPEAPEGWLAQLYLLHQRSSQHDLLIRHWPIGKDAPVICIDVPGSEPQPPIQYLTDARELVGQLLEVMMNDQESAHRRPNYSANQTKASGSSELPDLLRRAGVTS